MFLTPSRCFFPYHSWVSVPEHAKLYECVCHEIVLCIHSNIAHAHVLLSQASIVHNAFDYLFSSAFVHFLRQNDFGGWSHLSRHQKITMDGLKEFTRVLLLMAIVKIVSVEFRECRMKVCWSLLRTSVLQCVEFSDALLYKWLVHAHHQILSQYRRQQRNGDIFKTKSMLCERGTALTYSIGNTHTHTTAQPAAERYYDRSENNRLNEKNNEHRVRKIRV